MWPRDNGRCELIWDKDSLLSETKMMEEQKDKKDLLLVSQIGFSRVFHSFLKISNSNSLYVKF